MSGSRDRSFREHGQDWPAEDIEPAASPPPGQSPEDRWASGDLWPEPSRDAPPGWDDWPAQPVDDEYAVEEPAPPALSDPWGESWSGDASLAPASREPWDEPRGDEGPAPFAHGAPATDMPVETTRSSATPPAPATPEPRSPADPSWDATVDREPDQVPDRESERQRHSGAVGEPEAWSPPEHEPEASDAPEVEAAPQPVEVPAPSERGDASATAPFVGAFRGLGRAARTALPGWLAEPTRSRGPAPPEREADAAVGEPPRPDADRAEESPDEAAATLVGTSSELIDDPQAKRREASSAPPEPAETVADHELANRDAEPPAAEPLREPAASRPWWRAGGVWGSPSASDRHAVADADAPGEPGDVPEPEPPPELQPAKPVDGPAPPAGPGQAPELPERPDAGERGWDDPERPAVESTQVLPTSWAAPLPDVRPTPDPGAPLAPVGGDIRTRLREAREVDLDADEAGEPEPTTAEQAVPWLIGFILLLAGMVIVLLALIFAGDESLGGGGGSSPAASAPIGLVSESASLSPSVSAEPSPSPTATERADPSDTPAPTAAPTPTPLALPEYGPLEMIYQGRSAALAPIYLLHREFTVEGQPEVLAQDPALDVRRFAWAADGTVGVGLYEDVLVSVEIGTEKRRLGDGLSTVTFGDDAETVYAVRVGQDGDDDVATVLAIDFASADTREVASVSYARPDVAAAESLTEAQFADDGGPVRLYWMEDDVLMLWAPGGGAWEITPEDGDVTEVDGAAPVLWAPDRETRIAITDSAQSTLRLLDGDDEDVVASTTVGGLVSHLRWSPSGDRVVFTVARSAAGGGILQDLFLWDLADGAAPTQLTATGAAFGAEWRGSQPRWAFE